MKDKLLKDKTKLLKSSLKNVDIQIDHKERMNYIQTVAAKNFFFANNDICDFNFFSIVKKNILKVNFEFDYYNKIKSNCNIEIDQKLKNEPRIYCSFHYGSYKLINCILNENNIDYAVVVNHTIIESLAKYLDYHKTLKDNNKLSNSFELIDANSNSSIIQMIKMLKKGKSLLIYRWRKWFKRF